MRARPFLILPVLLPLLSGCYLMSNMFSKPAPPPCMRLSVLRDAAQITRQSNPNDPKTVSLHADLTSYQGSCSYDDKTKVMTMQFQVGIDATRGPAANASGRDVVAYFVSMPAYFPMPAAKKIYNMGFSFPQGSNTTHVVDKPVSVSIRVPDLGDLTQYEIYIGFQLNQAELDANRKTPVQP